MRIKKMSQESEAGRGSCFMWLSWGSLVLVREICEAKLVSGSEGANFMSHTSWVGTLLWHNKQAWGYVMKMIRRN